MRFSLSKSCWISPKLCTHVSNTENLQNYYQAQKKYMLKKINILLSRPSTTLLDGFNIYFFEVKMQYFSSYFALCCEIEFGITKNCLHSKKCCIWFAKYRTFHRTFSQYVFTEHFKIFEIKDLFPAQVQLALNPHYPPSWFRLPTNLPFFVCNNLHKKIGATCLV